MTEKNRRGGGWRQAAASPVVMWVAAACVALGLLGVWYTTTPAFREQAGGATPTATTNGDVQTFGTATAVAVGVSHVGTALAIMSQPTAAVSPTATGVPPSATHTPSR